MTLLVIFFALLIMTGQMQGRYFFLPHIAISTTINKEKHSPEYSWWTSRLYHDSRFMACFCIPMDKGKWTGHGIWPVAKCHPGKGKLNCPEDYIFLEVSNWFGRHSNLFSLLQLLHKVSTMRMIWKSSLIHSRSITKVIKHQLMNTLPTSLDSGQSLLTQLHMLLYRWLYFLVKVSTCLILLG